MPDAPASLNSIEQDTTGVGPLVSTQWLADHLDDPSVVVLEVSIDPPAQAAYSEGHIPGAHFVYWKDLLWHDTDREFPSPEVLAARLRALGAGDHTTIALVGDPFQFAAYAYWVMTMSGLEDRCRLVDGGRRSWVAEQRPLTTAVMTPSVGDLTPGAADGVRGSGETRSAPGLALRAHCSSTCVPPRNTVENASLRRGWSSTTELNEADISPAHTTCTSTTS